MRPASVGGSHRETRRCGSSGGSGKAIVVNTNHLPDEIVQPLVQLGSAVFEHARAHRDRSLAEYEQDVLGAWRTAAPALLDAVLQLATTGLEENARRITRRCPRCPRCQQTPNLGHQARIVLCVTVTPHSPSTSSTSRRLK